MIEEFMNLRGSEDFGRVEGENRKWNEVNKILVYEILKIKY